MVLDPNAHHRLQQPITIDAWQRQLRLWILRTGVEEVMAETGASRRSVYGWIRRRRPRLPRAAMIDTLEQLMGIRRSA